MSLEQGISMLNRVDKILADAVQMAIISGVLMVVNLVCFITYMVTMDVLRGQIEKDRKIELGQLPDPDYPSQPLYV